MHIKHFIFSFQVLKKNLIKTNRSESNPLNFHFNIMCKLPISKPVWRKRNIA